jgi:hypothetical protein
VPHWLWKKLTVTGPQVPDDPALNSLIDPC